MINIHEVNNPRNTDKKYYSKEFVSILLEMLGLGRGVKDTADQLALLRSETCGGDQSESVGEGGV
jgi:hypothetical protein